MYFNQYVDVLASFMVKSTRMHTLKLGHNNLRGGAGESVEKVLRTLQEMSSIRIVDVSHNTLGVSYGGNNPKFQGSSPPICILGDVIIKSNIENLDISFN